MDEGVPRPPREGPRRGAQTLSTPARRAAARCNRTLAPPVPPSLVPPGRAAAPPRLRTRRSSSSAGETGPSATIATLSGRRSRRARAASRLAPGLTACPTNATEAHRRPLFPTQAMKRIAEIRQKRSAKFIENRFKGKKARRTPTGASRHGCVLSSAVHPLTPSSSPPCRPSTRLRLARSSSATSTSSECRELRSRRARRSCQRSSRRGE